MHVYRIKLSEDDYLLVMWKILQDMYFSVYKGHKLQWHTYLLSSKLAILMWSIPASVWALASTLTSPVRGAWAVPQRTTWPFPWPSLPTPHRTPPEWEKLEGERGILMGTPYNAQVSVTRRGREGINWILMLTLSNAQKSPKVSSQSSMLSGISQQNRT